MAYVPDSQENHLTLPLLPLRDVVVFPHMVIPLFVGRPKSIRALEIAMEAGKSILLVAQKSAAKDVENGAKKNHKPAKRKKV
jgi:ATP-dependent Lon protease